ncbi:MAG: hypothetical protein K2O89_03750 [Clostridia bacterium]|nr:hypothetical protein [Clostridia bacterium]
MKKAIRNVVIGATCATMLFALTGCNDEAEHFDTENRPVAIAIGMPDGNFNPFFYSSANDGEIIGMTQISMLTADANGIIVCGDDEATFARDYSVTMYNAAGQEVTGGDVDHTTYEFVIKNGVKDSTGEEMSILDALFNLYVYLDPLYSGSTTIYSTKIKGLASYRSQQEGVDDDFDYEADARAAAQERFNKILDYDDRNGTTSYDEVKDDIQTVSECFLEELNSDWTSMVGTLSNNTEYRFTEDWELFMFNEGMVGYQYRYNSNNNRERYTDENGKYYTTLDDEQPGSIGYISSKPIIEYMTAALNGLTGAERAAKMQEAAVGLVFDNYFIPKAGYDGYYDGYGKGSLTEILQQWSAGNDAMRKFINNELSNSSGDLTNGLRVKSISGITTKTVTSFNGEMGVDLGGVQHDVLSITINGVDPAAIYNFAFVVAPMHYYSSSELVDYAKANWKNSEASNRFGVQFQNEEFMNNVVGNDAKRGAPVGAGAYKMKENDRFYDGSIVRYERNENFTTLGSDINNAKIKYLNYVYTTDDQMINSLTQQVIDYGAPQCTTTNINQLTGIDYLNMRDYDANGFGYVGINPKFIPDREVRMAIMIAMNPQNDIVLKYYDGTYAKNIYRPTSTTNFLNDLDRTGALSSAYVSSMGKTAGTTITWTDNANRITSLVESAGWNLEGGKYTKDGKTLTFTFTIAGDTTDHPAWTMFTNAANRLNELGFDITVKTDKQALISLATGNLAVWAAAWSTGIDPDLYQIYHKDSKASSTLNWGYETILNNSSIYDEENVLIQRISDEIDLARSTELKEERTVHYVNALNDIMELAVELPTYQRKDLGVYNNKVIKVDSLNQNPSANAGLLYKIWELDYN